MATPQQVQRRGRWSLILGTLFAFAAFAAVAYADNVQNDVVAGGNDTITAGGSTTVNYRIAANNGDGQTGCNAADATPATVTINAPAGVTPNPASLSFTSCGTDQSVTFSSSTAGNHAITVSVSDSGTGTYNLNPATFTLHVNAAPPSDTTSPTFNCTAPDQSIWYAADVTVNCTAFDSGSGLANAADASFSLSTSVAAGSETASAATGSKTISDNAGNPVTAGPYSFKVDKKAPTFLCATPPTAWSASDISINCTAADGGSGLTPLSDAIFALSTNVASGTETSSASTGTKVLTDAVGNSVTAPAITGLQVDKKGPTVTCGAAPSFLLNQSPASVPATAADGGSGPVSQNVSAAANTSTVGNKSVAVNAADSVGNPGSATCSYSVAYGFSGFSAPVDRPSTFNVSKAGQAIPLKWRLTDANGVGVTTLTSVSVVAASAGCGAGTTGDLLEEYAAGSSGLQNLGDGYYQFNWKTPSTYANSCKTIGLDLGEGSVRTGLALFSFKK